MPPRHAAVRTSENIRGLGEADTSLSTICRTRLRREFADEVWSLLLVDNEMHA